MEKLDSLQGPSGSGHNRNWQANLDAVILKMGSPSSFLMTQEKRKRLKGISTEPSSVLLMRLYPSLSYDAIAACLTLH